MIWQLKLTQLNVKTTTKKPSTKRRSKLPHVVQRHKLTQEVPLTSGNRGGVFFEVTKVDNGIHLHCSHMEWGPKFFKIGDQMGTSF